MTDMFGAYFQTMSHVIHVTMERREHNDHPVLATTGHPLRRGIAREPSVI